MKCVLKVLLVTGIAAAWMGCQVATDSEMTVDTDATNVSGDETLVMLKVPNMT